MMTTNPFDPVDAPDGIGREPRGSPLEPKGSHIPRKTRLQRE